MLQSERTISPTKNRGWLFVSWFATLYKSGQNRNDLNYRFFFCVFFSLSLSFFRPGDYLLNMGLSWAVDGNERSMIDARYWFGSSLIAVATQSRAEIYLFTREPKSLKVVQKIKADQQEGGGSYPVQDRFELFTDSGLYNKETVDRFQWDFFKGFLYTTFICISSFFSSNSNLCCSVKAKGSPLTAVRPVAKK